VALRTTDHGPVDPYDSTLPPDLAFGWRQRTIRRRLSERGDMTDRDWR
jgi:hypothetical protein